MSSYKSRSWERISPRWTPCSASVLFQHTCWGFTWDKWHRGQVNPQELQHNMVPLFSAPRKERIKCNPIVFWCFKYHKSPSGLIILKKNRQLYSWYLQTSASHTKTIYMGNITTGKRKNGFMKMYFSIILRVNCAFNSLLHSRIEEIWEKCYKWLIKEQLAKKNDGRPYPTLQNCLPYICLSKLIFAWKLPTQHKLSGS